LDAKKVNGSGRLKGNAVGDRWQHQILNVPGQRVIAFPALRQPT